MNQYKIDNNLSNNNNNINFLKNIKLIIINEVILN